MAIKKHIPNAITCLNLFSGCVACIMAFEGLYVWAFVWIMIAAVFDFLDGFAARLLNAYSAIGKELDSLADVISFGLAPGMMIFFFLRSITFDYPSGGYIPYFAFLIPVFSALRLAKFNIDTRQTESFLGLPVPANAIFWASMVAGTFEYTSGYRLIYITVLLILVVIFSLLLVSEIPMFSLKVKNLSWKDNKYQYILILSILVAVFFLKIAGFGVGILIYIFISFYKKIAAR